MTEASVRLREWNCAGPADEPLLRGRRLPADASVRLLADGLSESGRLRITELADGLRLEASAWVGRVRLGDLSISIEPKLPQLPLSGLLRYAYGWRDLKTLGPDRFATTSGGLLDLVIAQLLSEATDLLARGLHRDYVRRAETLASPCGRIDLQRYATAGPAAALPCIHHPRDADNDLNRMLLAGLRYAVGATKSLDLRVGLRRIAAPMELEVGQEALTRARLAAALRGLDRRTSRYGAALRLLGLILEGQSFTLADPPREIRLPGFLLDMNAFFQALLGRFLSEHLEDGELLQEERLHGLFAYDPGHNPRRRRDPEPRPDFVIRRPSAPDLILDAKYRDLWEHPLPRDMLYQLAIYALAAGGAGGAGASILYPSFVAGARDQVVVFQDVVRGMPRARVLLRAVDLVRLERALRDGPTTTALRERRRIMGEWLV